MKARTLVVRPLNRRAAHRFYMHAKNSTIERGGAAEIEWQNDRDLRAFTEADLLRESAWVILCSGFREAVVRERFPYISMCFGDWLSASEIVANAPLCIATASHAIGNLAKLRAIVTIAEHVSAFGFPKVKACLLNDPEPYVRKFPFIGNVTSRHLLKNLGFPVAKPDRHLLRIAQTFGYRSVDALCEEISLDSGDSIQTVDLVLWRYGVNAYARRLVQ